ncbi:hypothetical protein [Streptomyces sp. NPDC008139]|uniref:acyl-CoA-like ligand-binding transcription factor n=1 Tax=Streptomyces sp. NPDC008139 TaxID=3364814 RepID=UPI0036F0C97F
MTRVWRLSATTSPAGSRAFPPGTPVPLLPSGVPVPPLPSGAPVPPSPSGVLPAGAALIRPPSRPPVRRRPVGRGFRGLFGDQPGGRGDHVRHRLLSFFGGRPRRVAEDPGRRDCQHAGRDQVGHELNRFPASVVQDHRLRMSLLLNVPTLVAHSTLRYAAWRQAIAEYAARRLGVDEDDMRPQVIARAALAASLSAYEQWLKDEDADLPALVGSAFDILGETFSGEGCCAGLRQGCCAGLGSRVSSRSPAKDVVSGLGHGC